MAAARAAARPGAPGRSVVEAEPRDVRDLDECQFYHSMQLPSYGKVDGGWDLLGRFDDYTAGVDFAGRTVLDVGTATGFLTFEAERRGASVTSLDVTGPDDCWELPIRGSDYVEDHEAWRVRWGTRVERIKNSYWLCHRELGSRARCVYGDVYALTPEVGTFDVVLVGQLLVHLPDGLSAVAAAASVCGSTLVVVEGSHETPDPVALLSGRASRPDVGYAWYHYSHGWYREVLTMLGFRDVAISTAWYRCNAMDTDVELATVVATR